MKIWIGVENFAKIKTAKVCTNKYALLVGPNNCGKTYLMQLIDGVNDSWKIGKMRVRKDAKNMYCHRKILRNLKKN